MTVMWNKCLENTLNFKAYDTNQLSNNKKSALWALLCSELFENYFCFSCLWWTCDYTTMIQFRNRMIYAFFPSSTSVTMNLTLLPLIYVIPILPQNLQKFNNAIKVELVRHWPVWSPAHIIEVICFPAAQISLPCFGFYHFKYTDIHFGCSEEYLPH